MSNCNKIRSQEHKRARTTALDVYRPLNLILAYKYDWKSFTESFAVERIRTNELRVRET